MTTLLRVCVATQIKSIARGPNRSISRPRNGDTAAMTTRATVCTEESVALSHPNSSNIGLKNMLTATELKRNIIIQEAATMYHP